MFNIPAPTILMAVAKSCLPWVELVSPANTDFSQTLDYQTLDQDHRNLKPPCGSLLVQPSTLLDLHFIHVMFLFGFHVMQS